MTKQPQNSYIVSIFNQSKLIKGILSTILGNYFPQKYTMIAHTQPIGLILKEIAEEKRIKVKDIAEAKGISKQAVSNVWKRESIRFSELEVWAKILGVTSDEIIDRSRGQSTLNSVHNSKINSNDEVNKLIHELQMKYDRELHEHDKKLQEKDNEILYLRQQLAIANENLGKH